MTETQESGPHRLLFTALVLLTTVTAVSGSLGAPLVPGIAADFDASLTDAQWSLTLTMLAGAVATPVISRMSAGRACMRAVAHLLVDIGLARHPVPLLTHVTSLLMGIGVYMLFPLVVIVVQDPTWGMGHGATAAGLLLVPYALMSVVGSRVSLRLMLWVDATTLLPLGAVVYLSAFALLIPATTRCGS